jgi:hypothetical protein
MQTKLQFVLSPFVSSSLILVKIHVQQELEQHDCRAGVALKFGQEKKNIQSY